LLTSLACSAPQAPTPKPSSEPPASTEPPLALPTSKSAPPSNAIVCDASFDVDSTEPIPERCGVAKSGWSGCRLTEPDGRPQFHVFCLARLAHLLHWPECTPYATNLLCSRSLPIADHCGSSARSERWRYDSRGNLEIAVDQRLASIANLP